MLCKNLYINTVPALDPAICKPDESWVGILMDNQQGNQNVVPMDRDLLPRVENAILCLDYCYGKKVNTEDAYSESVFSVTIGGCNCYPVSIDTGFDQNTSCCVDFGSLYVSNL